MESKSCHAFGEKKETPLIDRDAPFIPCILSTVQHPLDYDFFVFDADGTLRGSLNDLPCPNTQEDWFLLPNVHATMTHYLPRSKNRFVIISNQGGVALGFLTQGMARDLLMALYQEVFPGKPMEFYFCPHDPHGSCVCRKPNPFFLLKAMYYKNVLRSRTLYVGDLESDRGCAERAGVDFCYAKDFFQWT